ncbi:hypothetical protein ACQ4PT_037835 [Festuca glaucescens]
MEELISPPEGMPTACFYGGNEVIDEVEELCRARALRPAPGLLARQRADLLQLPRLHRPASASRLNSIVVEIAEYLHQAVAICLDVQKQHYMDFIMDLEKNKDIKELRVEVQKFAISFETLRDCPCSSDVMLGNTSHFSGSC